MKFFTVIIRLCFVLSISSNCLCSAQSHTTLKGFAQNSGIVTGKTVKILADGSAEIKKESSRGIEDIFLLGAPALKPATKYLLTFNFKTSHVPNIESFVEITLFNGEGANRARTRCRILDASPEGSKINFSFETSSNPVNNLYVKAIGKVLAKISDLELTEGSAEKFLAVEKNTIPAAAKIPVVSGSKEFDVLPPAKTDGAVVNAADFGLDEGAEDCIIALNNALKHCREIGASMLVINKGVYNATAETPIDATGLKDFTIEGNGATLKYNKKKANNMIIKDCLRMKIQNLNMDWDWDKNPLGAWVKIVGKSEGENPYVDFKFPHYKKYPIADFYVANFTAFDTKTKTIGVEGVNPVAGMFNYGAKTSPFKIEWVSDNVARVFMPIEKVCQFTGTNYRIQHKYYHMGGILIDNAKHLTLENFNIYSCVGQAIRVTGQTQYLYLNNTNITIPKGDKKRVISSTADHFIMERSAGFIKLENCDFGYGADDCINVHDNTIFVEKISDKSLRSLRNRNDYIYKVGEEIELLNSDYTPTNYIGKVVGLKLLDNKKGISEIVFDKPLPPAKCEGFILLNKKYGTRNVIIRNCKFHNNRARGVLILAKDVTIENCVFERNEMGSIKIETGYTLRYWAEGYGVDNVLIRNNIFDSCNVLGAAHFGRERDVYMGTYMRTDPSEAVSQVPVINNVLFENNVFKNTFGVIAYISSSNNVAFVGNKIVNTISRKNKCAYRGGFVAANSKNVLIQNNVYDESVRLNKDGLGVYTESPSEVALFGNRIVSDEE